MYDKVLGSDKGILLCFYCKVKEDILFIFFDELFIFKKN